MNATPPLAGETFTSDTPQGSPYLIGPIGICLSGGGYRAAAYHLGTLDYLDHVGLASEIRQLSSVSGGTFVGVKYTMSLVEGQPFETFFNEFHDFLRDTDLIKQGLARLAGPPPHTPSRRHDLIVAMASIYADTFLCNADGSPYLFAQVLDADIALTDAVFNATEFRHGLAFRFQRASNHGAPIGNAKLRIRREAAGQIRLADIVAASSCFPAGFEPMGFPYDFAWPDGKIPESIENKFTTDGVRTPVALMDGGVFDNQGLSSLLLAGGRGRDELGVFIISDVDQDDDELCSIGPAPEGPTGMTLGRLRNLAMLGAALSLASLVALAWELARRTMSQQLDTWDILLLLIPALLAFTAGFGLLKLQRLVLDRVLVKVPQVGRGAWKDLKKIRVSQIAEMIELRFSSLISLTSKVFMKRIRGLVYSTIYADETYEGKRVSNLIGTLAAGSKWPTGFPEGIEQTSDKLQEVIAEAENMPTTLWFDRAHKLPCLIACGQATICFNLLKWVWRTHGAEPAAYSAQLRELWEKLVADWARLNADPYSLLAERLPESSLVRPCA